MSRQASKLTLKKVREAGPGKYADGNGLYLIVTGNGAKHWIVRVQIKGQTTPSGLPKRFEYGLGSTTFVSLTEARDTAIEYQRLGRQGIDPKPATRAAVSSFEVVARAFYEQHKLTLSNPKHAAQWITSLEKYAFPTIGDLPVDQIAQPEVLQCIEPIWLTKHETATRVMQRIGKVLDVASSKGLRSGSNPVEIIKVANVLPSQRTQVEHHKSMPFENVPAFFSRLKDQQGTAAMALQFVILTAARTKEVIEATWPEYDSASCIWTIDSSRMKARRRHMIPITDSCVMILNQMHQQSHSDWVFEGQRRGRPLSNMAMANVLKRMKVTEATVHGFRTSFRGWCGENGIEREIAELCLAHQIGNAVEQAYNRSDYLDRRRDVMTRWASFVSEA